MVFSETSPRWGDKFDFVMINAGAQLHINVYAKSNAAFKVLNTVNVFKKKQQEEVGWDKMGWDGVEQHGMAWYAMQSNAIRCS